MRTINQLAIRVFLAVSLIAGAARAQEYKIKLHYVEKVGDTTPIVAEGTSSESSIETIPGHAPLRLDNTISTKLSGERNVLEVDEKGNATKISVVIKSFTVNGQPALAPGAVLLAESAGATRKDSANGARVDIVVSEAMDLLFPFKTSMIPDDDALFGTPQPREVGDSWPINASETSKSAGRGLMPVQIDKINGATKLVSAQKVDGREWLQLKTELGADGLAGRGPGGVMFVDGGIKMQTEVTIAANDRVIPLTTSVSLESHLVGHPIDPAQKTYKVEITTTRETKVETGAAATNMHGKL